MSKDHLTYGDFTSLVADLAREVDSKYAGVASVNRGGLPVGVELSHRLDLPHGVVSATSYDDGEKTDLTFHGSLLTHMERGELLVVDDVVDTGETMERVAAFVDDGGYTVTTASLHAKPLRKFDPDHYVEETDDWIVYPWETEL